MKSTRFLIIAGLLGVMCIADAQAQGAARGKFHPGQLHDRAENRFDRRENIRDRVENRWDRRK